MGKKGGRATAINIVPRAFVSQVPDGFDNAGDTREVKAVQFWTDQAGGADLDDLHMWRRRGGVGGRGDGVSLQWPQAPGMRTCRRLRTTVVCEARTLLIFSSMNESSIPILAPIYGCKAKANCGK